MFRSDYRKSILPGDSDGASSDAAAVTRSLEIPEFDYQDIKKSENINYVFSKWPVLAVSYGQIQTITEE